MWTAFFFFHSSSTQPLGHLTRDIKLSSSISPVAICIHHTCVWHLFALLFHRFRQLILQSGSLSRSQSQFSVCVCVCVLAFWLALYLSLNSISALSPFLIILIFLTTVFALVLIISLSSLPSTLYIVACSLVSFFPFLALTCLFCSPFLGRAPEKLHNPLVWNIYISLFPVSFKYSWLSLWDTLPSRVRHCRTVPAAVLAARASLTEAPCPICPRRPFALLFVKSARLAPVRRRITF